MAQRIPPGSSHMSDLAQLYTYRRRPRTWSFLRGRRPAGVVYSALEILEEKYQDLSEARARDGPGSLTVLMMEMEFETLLKNIDHGNLSELFAEFRSDARCPVCGTGFLQEHQCIRFHVDEMDDQRLEEEIQALVNSDYAEPFRAERLNLYMDERARRKRQKTT